MKHDDLDVIEAMEQIGGSFVKALAAAARRADETNYQKLKTAFPEFWTDYEEMARLKKKHKDKDA